MLIGPTSPLGYPAPFWFIEFFKVLGFTLHMIPMHLWYAGLIVVAVLALWGGAQGQAASRRLIGVMPIVIALGVNLGIVPLLFTQVAYYRVFYPATILMAWPWFSIIILLTVAYYGVYLYTISVRRQWSSRVGIVAGWVSAILFTIMGFIFANNFSLMVNISQWPTLWQRTSVAAAPLGIALNTGDPTLVPRWLMMFGLAITTTAVYLLVDTAFFARGMSAAYIQWSGGFAALLYTIGLAIFAVMGSWYIFGALPRPILDQAMGSTPLALLFALTALSPGLPWLLTLAQRRGTSRRLILATALAQVLVLALNAVSRQWVQNAGLARFVEVGTEPVNLQASPLVIFLVLFVLGLGVVFWMISTVIAVERQTPASGALS
jgi:hypothetical protein